MGKYKFTELHRFVSDDSTLITLIVRADWKHGIYRTDESEVLTVIVTPDDYGMIDSRGQELYPVDHDMDDHFGAELGEFVGRLT